MQLRDEDCYGRQLLMLCAREDERNARRAALKRRAPLWKRWVIGLLVLLVIRCIIKSTLL